MVIIDGNLEDTFLSKHLLNLTDHKVISSQSAHVLNDNVSNVSGLNLIHHLNEAGAIKSCTGNTIICEMTNRCQAMCLCIAYS